jgi:signal transduction histidine kinase
MKSRSINSSQDNLNPSGQNVAERTMSTTLPVSPALLNLGSQAYLIELFPMAAYAVRAPDGVIAWFNSRAAQLWGRTPVIGDTDERFCGAHRLYHSDGSYMAHCDTPVALALETGASVHEEEVVIERPDGSRVTVEVHIDPIRDKDGTIVGVVNFFHDITERKQAERDLREKQEQLRNLADGLDIQVRARTNELEQRNEVVLQQSEQLRELSNRLLRTQDEERRRIARDLHDSAGQIISVLGMNLASVTQRAGQNREIRKVVEESHELVHQLSTEIRTVSYLLHPPMLDETGLADAISLYIKGLEDRSGLKIKLCIPKDFERLPDDIELAIFRIVQECLTNIHRHSGSKTAAIQVSRDAENVFLEIQDEGTGIPDEKLSAIRTQRAGVGFSGMRERVRHLRGILNIQSSSNGTKISATFPVSTTTISASDITGQRAKAAQ